MDVGRALILQYGHLTLKKFSQKRESGLAVWGGGMKCLLEGRKLTLNQTAQPKILLGAQVLLRPSLVWMHLEQLFSSFPHPQWLSFKGRNTSWLVGNCAESASLSSAHLDQSSALPQPLALYGCDSGWGNCPAGRLSRDQECSLYSNSRVIKMLCGYLGDIEETTYYNVHF